MPTRAGGPIEDLGDEASSGSESGDSSDMSQENPQQQCCLGHLRAVCTRLNQEFKVLPVGSEDEEQDMDQAYDSLASNLGIDHFSVMLRRAIKQEQDDLLGQAKRPKYTICASRLHSIAVVFIAMVPALHHSLICIQ